MWIVVFLLYSMLPAEIFVIAPSGYVLIVESKPIVSLLPNIRVVHMRLRAWYTLVDIGKKSW